MASFDAHCALLILQHPGERKKYYGTAKLVQKAIQNSKLKSQESLSEREIEEFLQGKNAYLLYPSSSASFATDRELTTEDCLIVLDGTWSQAGKLLHSSPSLQSFPRLSFSKQYISHYRIRKQPDRHCLSTLEAIAYFLLESSNCCDAKEKANRIKQAYSLLEGFRIMVEQQLDYWKSWEPFEEQLRLGIQRKECTQNIIEMALQGSWEPTI